MPTYNATLILTDIAGNGTKTLTGELSDDELPPNPSPGGIDFSADFSRLENGHAMESMEDWNAVFSEAIAQGVIIKTGRHAPEKQKFTIRAQGRNGGNCLELSSPKGSYGMQKFTQLWLGKPATPVNVEWDFMINTTDGSDTNLFTAGGGKWLGGPIQWGPIESGPTGGIRLMPIWAAGASTLGRQSLIVGIQDQRDGRQWLQPPMASDEPIEQGRWYLARIRMTGGSAANPHTVRCEYWLDGKPKLDYTAVTDNPNVRAGMAEVFIDICGFWGGGEANGAPADAGQYAGEKFRAWVE